MPYTLSIKAIKKLLMNEAAERVNVAYALLREHTFCADYFLDEINSVKDQIEKIETNEQLEKFVRDHYRMSTQEWIDSL